MDITATLDTNIALYLLGGRLLQPLPDRALRGFRREHRIKLPDAVVAATALHLGVELITNDQRLARTPGLRCRPWPVS